MVTRDNCKTAHYSLDYAFRSCMFQCPLAGKGKNNFEPIFSLSILCDYKKMKCLEYQTALFIVWR